MRPGGKGDDMSHAGHRSVELKDPGYELFIGAVSLL